VVALAARARRRAPTRVATWTAGPGKAAARAVRPASRTRAAAKPRAATWPWR